MPRSSRHRSQKRGDGWECSDSEEEVEDPKERKKHRDESCYDVLAPGNVVDSSGGKEKKRSERELNAQECNGDDMDGRVRSDLQERREFRSVDAESLEVYVADPKSKSSGKKHEGSAGRRGESGRGEGKKRNQEKGSARVESSSQNDDLTERDRERRLDRSREHESKSESCDRRSEFHRESVLDTKGERCSEGDDRAKDRKHDRFSGIGSRKPAHEEGSNGKYFVKLGKENIGEDVHTDLQNSDLRKNLEESARRRRNNSSIKDKWHDDSRECDDRRLVYTDDFYKRCRSDKDGRYTKKDLEYHDREERLWYEKGRDHSSSRDYITDRSENKHHKDVKKRSESHTKRNEIQDNDHGCSSYDDDHSVRSKYDSGRKRSFDENRGRDAEHHKSRRKSITLEENTLVSCNLDFNDDRDKLESIHSNRIDSSPINGEMTGSSATFTADVIADDHRYNLGKVESTNQIPLLEGQHINGSPGNYSILSEHCCERKSGEVVCLDDSPVHTAAVSEHERTPWSERNAVASTERSPSSSNGRRYLNKNSRHIFDADDVEQRSSYSKIGRGRSNNEKGEHDPENITVEEKTQHALHQSDSGPLGSLPSCNPHRLSHGSPNHFAAKSRCGTPGLDSFEVCNGVHAARRGPDSYSKRNWDGNTGRHGNTWKSIPSWPPPMSNGFIPFSHGPPTGGFHPSLQQFPAPPVFGIRPSVDFHSTGASFHMPEIPGGFSSHARPFGWPNQGGDSYHHLQGWDTRNSFGDDPNIYRRPDLEPNRLMLRNSGWDMSSHTWNGQNKVPYNCVDNQKDLNNLPRATLHETGTQQLVNKLPIEPSQLENIEVEQSNGPETLNDNVIKQLGTTSANSDVGTSLLAINGENAAVSSCMPNDGIKSLSTYLSMLDVSVDLAHPELYNQCIDIIGNRDHTTENFYNFCGTKKNIYEDIRVVGLRDSSKSKTPFFHRMTDIAFQRAVNLCKKHAQVAKCKTGLPISPIAQGIDPLETDSQAKTASKVQAKIEDSSPSCFDHPNAMGENACKISSDGFKDESFGTVAVSGDGFIKNSFQGCELLMEDCKVNLSRIQSSPENTH